MDLIIYIFSAVFALLAAALVFTWWRSRHVGALLMALNYVAAAGTALYMSQWWPLVIGFFSAWALRLMGLEPGAAQNAKSTRQET